MSLTLITLCTVLNIWPGDFTTTYHYVSGSIPPPYHYEYTVTIDTKGNGVINYKPDYVFNTLWTESFHLNHKSMRKFWSFLKKNDFFTNEWADADKHPVGGSIEYLEIFSNGKPIKIPAFPLYKEKAEKILSVVKKIIPQNLIDSLSAKRKEKNTLKITKTKK